MYDVKHKRVYMRIKVFGKSDPIPVLCDGGLVLCMQEAMRIIVKLPPRYGPSHIEWQFEPFDYQLTTQESALREMIAMIDPNQIEMETEEDVARDRWHINPMNPQSSNYDPLYHEYQNCSSSKHRELKTPKDLAMLRKHMEIYYEGTEWWDGSHRW